LASGMVILGLCAAVRPWNPISWSSQQTVHIYMLPPLLKSNLRPSLQASMPEIAKSINLKGCPQYFCIWYHVILPYTYNHSWWDKDKGHFVHRVILIQILSYEFRIYFVRMQHKMYL
jgi:hypothetical protein